GTYSKFTRLGAAGMMLDDDRISAVLRNEFSTSVIIGRSTTMTSRHMNPNRLRRANVLCVCIACAPGGRVAGVSSGARQEAWKLALRALAPQQGNREDHQHQHREERDGRADADIVARERVLVGQHTQV